MIFSAPVVFLNSYLSQKKNWHLLSLDACFCQIVFSVVKIGECPEFPDAEKTPQPRATRLPGLGIIAQVVFIESASVAIFRACHRRFRSR
jgi:hypothetical protein